MKNKNLVSIKLPLEIWEEIASTCIYLADWYELETGNILPDEDKEVLRKTYFQIKAETR